MDFWNLFSRNNDDNETNQSFFFKNSSSTQKICRNDKNDDSKMICEIKRKFYDEDGNIKEEIKEEIIDLKNRNENIDNFFMHDINNRLNSFDFFQGKMGNEEDYANFGMNLFKRANDFNNINERRENQNENIKNEIKKREYLDDNKVYEM